MPIKHSPSSAIECISERCWQHLCFEHWPLPFIGSSDFPCMASMTFWKYQYSCHASELNFSFSLLLLGFVNFWRNISFIKAALITSKTDIMLFLSLLIVDKGVCFLITHIAVLGLCGKGLLEIGLQGWLLWEVPRSFPCDEQIQCQIAPRWTSC